MEKNVQNIFLVKLLLKQPDLTLLTDDDETKTFDKEIDYSKIHFSFRVDGNSLIIVDNDMKIIQRVEDIPLIK